jgi:hypothetical protein
MSDIKGRCEPAYEVCTKLGGISRTAKLLGISQPAVSRWCSPAGTRGTIPVKYWKKILTHSAKYGIRINLHLLSGISPRVKNA